MHGDSVTARTEDLEAARGLGLAQHQRRCEAHRLPDAARQQQHPPPQARRRDTAREAAGLRQLCTVWGSGVTESLCMHLPRHGDSIT
jgi:hypothetical protein